MKTARQLARRALDISPVLIFVPVVTWAFFDSTGFSVREQVLTGMVLAALWMTASRE